MRILMVGGGTAGHINPALAIADTIKSKHKDAEILFVGVKGKMETALVPAAGYSLQTITVQGFQRRLSLKNIGRNMAAAYHAVTASAEAAHIIKAFSPDLAIGTGGYVCGPVLRQAAKAGVPVLLHESNALPGMTVKMLAKQAKVVMIASEAARQYLPKDVRVQVTGNPLRRDFAVMDRTQARRELGVDERPLVLCFGGSLGARHLNEAIGGVLYRNQVEQKLQFIVGTGKGENYTKMQALLAEQGVKPDGVHVRVREYIDDMPRCMAAADLVISRCGAMTISELPVMKKPSVLVPSPYVAENHQFHNAMALAQRGAAICIEEKDLTDAFLWDTIEKTALCPDVLAGMSKAAGEMAVSDAHERIYAIVEEFINTK